MTDPVILRARELAVAEKQWGRVVERAILNGAYDEGELVKKHLMEAEADLLRNRPEAGEE